jgi:hypothetical protein
MTGNEIKTNGGLKTPHNDDLLGTVTQDTDMTRGAQDEKLERLISAVTALTMHTQGPSKVVSAFGGLAIFIVTVIGSSMFWSGQRTAEATSASSRIERLETRVDYLSTQFEVIGKQLSKLEGMMTQQASNQRR